MEQAYQRWKSIETEDVVSQIGAVTRNVAQRPDGLFSHIGFGRVEELDEDGDGISADDSPCLT